MQKLSKELVKKLIREALEIKERQVVTKSAVKDIVREEIIAHYENENE
tara:strand:- start:480 stop:623 length:144 start_codon:yes stop_codon:yes gene_type:complete